MTDDEYNTEFRIFKDDNYQLGEVLVIPDIMKCPNGVLVDAMEAFGVLWKRFAYPCRFTDMVTQFGRPVPQLCLTTNRVMDYVFGKCSFLIARLNQPWLSKDRSQKLENCWGFIDGTVRPLCMPNQNQKILYHGHKRVHGIKVQCAVTPNGLIASPFGPVSRRHDIGLLVDSGLLQELS